MSVVNSGVSSVKSEMWGVECQVLSVKCKVWRVECTVESAKCTVLSVKCGVSSADMSHLGFLCFAFQFLAMAGKSGSAVHLMFECCKINTNPNASIFTHLMCLFSDNMVQAVASYTHTQQ